MAAGLNVEPFIDSPIPRVGITLTGLDSVAPSTVTVWRSTAGGKRRRVRGWANRVVYGSDYALDYEAPLGREITYDLQVVSGAVVPPQVSATTTLNVDRGYIQDPLLPLSGVPVYRGLRPDGGVALQASAFRKLSYDVQSSLVTVLGSDEPVALTGQRLAASGLDFSVITNAAQQGTDLRNLLRDSPLVLVRTLPSWGPLPDLIYVVAQVTEEPLNASYGGSMTWWKLSGDSVAPPSMQVLVALWTYDQVAALWTTYDAAQAAAAAISATYLDDQRDPTKGV